MAKINRITTAEDYRTVVRRGARFTFPHTIIYVQQMSSGSAARFGFIVSKSVGTAVTRNLVRRRLKATCYSILPELDQGYRIVIRALPGSQSQSYQTLYEEISKVLKRSNAE